MRRDRLPPRQPPETAALNLTPQTELRPLTARSVILSLLLGTHPPRLPVRTLVAVGGLMGMSEGSVRVALSRLAADGDLTAADGWYELSSRFLRRQQALDAGRSPATRPWRGQWEVIVSDDELSAWHLAPLRPGVWVRPDNLDRPPPAGHRFVGRPDGEPEALVARLWDLPDWAREGRALVLALEREREPARRFALAAAVARHLRSDPLLPPALLAPAWPGPELRRAYHLYAQELNRRLRA